MAYGSNKPFSAPHPSPSWLPCARGKHLNTCSKRELPSRPYLMENTPGVSPGGRRHISPRGMVGNAAGDLRDGDRMREARPHADTSAPCPRLPPGTARCPPGVTMEIPSGDLQGTRESGPQAGPPSHHPPPPASLRSAARPRPPAPPTHKGRPGKLNFPRGAPAAGGGREAAGPAVGGFPALYLRRRAGCAA